MTVSNARHVSPAADLWLKSTKRPRYLHVFRRTINLINEQGEICSLVAHELGPDPLAIVLERMPVQDVDLRTLIDSKSQISVDGQHLRLGLLTVNLSSAELWKPCPSWHLLSAEHLDTAVHIVEDVLRSYVSREGLVSLLFGRRDYPYLVRADKSWRDLAQGICQKDAALVLKGCRQLAGLGPGLTPAGDDFLLGLFYAVHANQAEDTLNSYVKLLAEVAANRTTSLSAAWLAAASRGEANWKWHMLAKAIGELDRVEIWNRASEIAQIGQTSGADSLTGFVMGTRIIRPLTAK